MSGGWPDYGQDGSGERESRVHWVAVIVAFAALLVSGFTAYRAQMAQDKANSLQEQSIKVAEQNDRIAQKNTELQKQLQAQGQAAQIRSSAQQVVLTTSPAELSPGQPVQGLTIDNGTHKEITAIYVIFTTGPRYAIADSAYYPSLTPCMSMTLSFGPNWSPLPVNDWDAWIYFTDADGNVWLTDLSQTHFQKITSAQSARQAQSAGQPVTKELVLSSSSLNFCG
jgi:hypothetical protein